MITSSEQVNSSFDFSSPETKAVQYIQEVKTPAEMKVFINFPYELYAGNPCYLPALKSDVLQNFDERTNPAFEFCKVRYLSLIHI